MYLKKKVKMRRSYPVLFISNDLSNKNNTLTSFSGCIPHDYLNKNKSWKVTVDSCGLHFMLKQPIASKYENHPSLIQISYEELNKKTDNMEIFELSYFDNGLKLFVDRERPYTQKSLVEDFLRQEAIHRSNHRKFDGIPFKYNEESETISFGQFEMNGDPSNGRISKLPKEKRRNLRTFVFINARFMEGLKIKPLSNLKLAKVNGEKYYRFFNSKYWDKSSPVVMSMEKNFPLKEPEIIQITSHDIEHNINSGKFCLSLCQFTVKQSELKTFVNKEFNNHVFSNVLNNYISQFSIKFVDEKLNELHLTRGLPSWVKLIFSPEMEGIRNVIISSEKTQLHPENSMSNFTMELKDTMDFSFTDDPKVALTKLSFKNKWKIMSGLKLNIFIYNCATRKVIGSYNCPRGDEKIRNCDDIIRWCKELLDDEISVKLKKKDDGTWRMIFPQNMNHVIILGRDLAQCLGLSYLHQKSGKLFIDLRKINGGSRESTSKFIRNQLYSEEVSVDTHVSSAINRYIYIKYKVPATDLPFQSTGDIAMYCDSPLSFDIILPPRKMELYPNELYIFFNIVEPWPVMGQYRELLKIVPLKRDDQDENVTIDFQRPEYHALSVLHPRLLKFKISTVEGALIEPFNKEDTMYLNLQFSYN